MRTLCRWLVAFSVAGAGVLLVAGPAAAELSGPCTASGRFEDSKVTVDPNATSGPIDVERKDTVSYTAAVEGATAPRAVSGEIKIDMPAPWPDITAGDWDDDDSDGVDKTDTYTYNLPAIAPRGFDVEVSGFHQDKGLPKCSGHVTLHIKGGFFSSPAGPIALVITALSAAGLVIAARPKKLGGA